MAVCKYQHPHSRYFVHEHIADALSWNEDSVKEVMLLPGVIVSRFDQCRFGLTSPYSGATIRKRTKFLHNVPALDAEFGDCFCSCRTPPSTNNWSNTWNPVELLLPSVPAGALQGHVATNRASDSKGAREVVPRALVLLEKRGRHVSCQCNFR